MNDNKLIAEFDEVVFHDDENQYYSKYGLHIGSTLEYHTDWNWLIPVVDKIESIRGVYRRGGMTKGGQQHNATETRYVMEYGMHDKVMGYAYANRRIDAEYQAVVQFIKEFNLKS